MHKSPIKPRFIIVSPKSSIRPLSQAIASAFRFFYRQIEPQNNKCRFCTGVSTVWVAQSNKTVLKTSSTLEMKLSL